jgi:prostaglandin E receptor 4
MLKIFIFFFWCGGALLTYLPLFGFGLYYSDGSETGTGGRCCRYRDATKLLDQIYAYLFLVFGKLLFIKSSTNCLSDLGSYLK